MPVFEYYCDHCRQPFDLLRLSGAAPEAATCPGCRRQGCARIASTPAIRTPDGGAATRRIERRVRDYLIDGKARDATRFADKAAAMTGNDRVKRIADKLHSKTGD